MQKKQLMLELRGALDKEVILSNEISRLSEQLADAERQRAELDERIAKLEATNAKYAETIALLTAEKDSENTPNENITEPASDAEEGETVAAPAEEAIEFEELPTEDTVVEEKEADAPKKLDLSAFDKLTVSAEMEYASEMIGKTVVKCASVCNDFAKLGGVRARELINLSLGKTEVFKADCLTIASSDAPLETKKQYIDRIYRDTDLYFDSLRKQNIGEDR